MARTRHTSQQTQITIRSTHSIILSLLRGIDPAFPLSCCSLTLDIFVAWCLQLERSLVLWCGLGSSGGQRKMAPIFWSFPNFFPSFFSSLPSFLLLCHCISFSTQHFSPQWHRDSRPTGTRTATRKARRDLATVITSFGTNAWRLFLFSVAVWHVCILVST